MQEATQQTEKGMQKKNAYCTEDFERIIEGDKKEQGLSKEWKGAKE